MGILYWKVLEEPTMIRIAIVVCCAALAAAEAEADPAVFYSSYGHHGLYQPAYSTYRYPTTLRSYAAPLTTSYSGHYYPGYQAGFTAPATVGAHQPYGYAASGRYLANSVGAVTLPRGRLRLSQKLRLRLTPLCSTTLTDTRVSTTPATTCPTPPPTTPTPLSTPGATTSLPTTTLDTGPSTERGRLRLSQKLRLRLIPL